MSPKGPAAVTRGDPDSPLRWTSKSGASLAEVVRGHDFKDLRECLVNDSVAPSPILAPHQSLTVFGEEGVQH